MSQLRAAYAQGTFPWFSAGQPILWWAPDPRMVLKVAEFRLHRSLRKTLNRFRADAACEIRIDSAFDQVIRSCSSTAREGQNGTWIVPAMVAAYEALHAQGTAHSVETWVDGKLAGGLYCVAIGHAVFGESMFAHALMARSNSPTLGHPKFPQAGPPDYDDSGATAMRAAASLRR